MAKKKQVTTRRTTLYTYISPASKNWLDKICKQQVGKVSKSTMVEKIFHNLRKHPELVRALSL